MPRPKEVIDGELVEKAERELRSNRDYKIGVRLKAILSAYRQPMGVVARVFGISRNTLWQWITRFREFGVEGLQDKPKGHNPAKLSREQKAEIAVWLRKGKNRAGEVVHWTITKLAQEIQLVFNIKLSYMPLWLTVHNLGFRQKVPRPAHLSADLEKQAEFKKNCTRRMKS